MSTREKIQLGTAGGLLVGALGTALVTGGDAQRSHEEGYSKGHAQGLQDGAAICMGDLRTEEVGRFGFTRQHLDTVTKNPRNQEAANYDDLGLALALGAAGTTKIVHVTALAQAGNDTDTFAVVSEAAILGAMLSRSETPDSPIIVANDISYTGSDLLNGNAAVAVVVDKLVCEPPITPSR